MDEGDKMEIKTTLNVVEKRINAPSMPNIIILLKNFF